MALFKIGSKKKSSKKSSTGLGSKLKKHSKAKLAFLSLAALLLLTTVGYTGFTIYKRNELKAQAAGWTYLTPNSNNGSIKWMRACKTLVPNTGYGNLWKVQYQVYRNDSRVYYTVIEVWRPPSSSFYATTTQKSWLYGVVAGSGVTVSKDLGDKMYLRAYYSHDGKIGWAYGLQNGTSIINPANLVTC